jgi:predicted nucleic acid-binding protein
VYLWDTDVVGHFANEHPILSLHIQRVKWDEIALPSSTVAELLRGRAEFAVKAAQGQIPFAHGQLRQTLQLIAKFRVFFFNEKADEALKSLLKTVKSSKRYVDLMTAAMAIAGNHIVITRNIRHFKDVLPPHQLANWIDDLPS